MVPDTESTSWNVSLASLKNARLPVGLFADTDASGPPAHVVQERTPGSVWPKAIPANKSTAKVKVKMGIFRLVIASSSKGYPRFLGSARTQPYCRLNGTCLPKVDGKVSANSAALQTEWDSSAKSGREG